MSNVVALPVKPYHRPRELSQPFFNGHIDLRDKGYTDNFDEATELAAKRRNLWCPNYEKCLDLAIAADWNGWDCEGCPCK